MFSLSFGNRCGFAAWVQQIIIFYVLSMSVLLNKYKNCKLKYMIPDNISNIILLHIMCGYQCDKAVNKNDTREVI